MSSMSVCEVILKMAKALVQINYYDLIQSDNVTRDVHKDEGGRLFVFVRGRKAYFGGPRAKFKNGMEAEVLTDNYGLKNEEIESRSDALKRLLKPITWNCTTSIQSRKDLVMKSRQEVRTILPFLNPDELARAKKWLDEEHHNGLWD